MPRKLQSPHPTLGTPGRASASSVCAWPEREREVKGWLEPHHCPLIQLSRTQQPPLAGQARSCVGFILQPPQVTVSRKRPCSGLDASSSLQGPKGLLTDSTTESGSRTHTQKPTKGFWMSATFRLKLLPPCPQESILTQKGIPKE